MHYLFSGWLCCVVLCLSVSLCAPQAATAELDLQQDDRIVFIGNTLAERMREYNYFETLLRCRFPHLNLTFRNMGWSADEVDLRPRPLNFGDVHQHLTDQKADVIFLCYGLNESFAGEDGIGAFIEDYSGYIDELRAHEYNGETAPRLVMVSPTPQEPIAAMPDVFQRNLEIGRYTDAMRSLAEEKEIPFVDLFNGLNAWRDRAGGVALTFNGIHMEAEGYWAAALVTLGQLGWSWPDQRVVVDVQEETASGTGTVRAALAGSGQAHQITLESLAHPAPTPPANAAAGSATIVSPPVLQITGLAPGTYGVYIDGERVAAGDEKAFAQGVAVHDGEAQAAADSALAGARHKNRLFFDRWRAVNGYYIYGGRKEPFGVQSFPPEMQRFDELVREEEAVINASLQAYTERVVELRREDSDS